MSSLDSKRLAIAKRLRIAREMAGLSQSQVAVMLGLHRPSISEVEAGRRKVSAEELARLAKIYDVDVDWVMEAKAESDEEVLARVELAARELSKLKSQDLKRLLDLLKALRENREV